MALFLNLEKLLESKHINQHTIVVFYAIFAFFVLLGICTCMLEGAIFSTIILLLIATLAFTLSKEVKESRRDVSLLAFQKNLISNSYDASQSACFIFSDTGKLVFISKLATELFPNASIRNIDDFLELFYKYNKIMPAVKNVMNAVENGRIAHVDVPFMLDATNSVCWRIFATPVHGFKRYTLWSITDLTPTLQSLDMLSANTSFLIDVINSSDELIFAINEQGIFTFCNTSFARALGMHKSDVIGKNLKDFVVQRDSAHFPVVNGCNKLTQSIPSNIVFKSEKTSCKLIVKQIWMSKDGSTRAFSATKSKESDDRLVEVLGTTKVYFEKIFENAPVGIAITNGAEIIDACNKTFRDITGYYDESHEKDVSFLDFVIDDSKEEVKKKLYELLNAVYSSEKPIEVRIKNNDKVKTITMYANKLDTTDGENTQNGLVLYFIDITERKNLQNQFVQSQKMQAIGQLAGGIAHDFNNLLTAMIGYCDLLLGKYKPTDQPFSDIMQIKQNANRASNLVRQLLAFSRQQSLQPKVMNVAGMLVDLESLLSRLLGAKIELAITYSRDVGCIKVDQVQFEQVIINLIVNARDSMPNGGELKINVENFYNEKQRFFRGDEMPAGAYVAISISDTGSGIPEDIINRIFDPFFSTKEKGHGTGLGLSTVYGIVKQTGGCINVNSSVGEGTTFTLYFPICECRCEVQENQVYHETIVHADLTGNGKILLVEDEDAVRVFCARALRDKGYSVIEAQNGESALEFIKSDGTSIDLMITDVVMPKMDGPTLIRYVSDFAPKMRVIFISGYTEDNFRQSLADDNTSIHFLQKPFSLNDLATKVKEIMSL